MNHGNIRPWQLFQVEDRPLLERYERWREIGKILGLSKRARLRLEWMIYYESRAKRNAALTARHFGINRDTFYHWRRRFCETNLRSLEDHSRRPKNVRQPEYQPHEETRLVDLRKLHPSLGHKKLRVLYHEAYNEPISEWTCRRIIHDRKLFAKRAIKNRHKIGARRGLPKKRITELVKKPLPGYLIEADTIVLYFNNEKRYILTAIDHYSRLAYARMYRTKRAANAADFLKRLYLLLDGHIENLHVDNGSEFKREFEEAASELDINLYHARPFHAQDKPFIERWNGILQQEFVDLGNFTLSVEEFNRHLTEWLIYYNFVRPHHSLGLKRPAEFANMKPLKVSGMYSPITKGCNNLTIC